MRQRLSECLPDVGVLQPQVPSWRQADELAGARLEADMPLVLEARRRRDLLDLVVVGLGDVEAGFIASFSLEEVHGARVRVALTLGSCV